MRLVHDGGRSKRHAGLVLISVHLQAMQSIQESCVDCNSHQSVYPHTGKMRREASSHSSS